MTEYLNRLRVLQDIRRIAGGELSLPQICVVGDQSSGKSSVLTQISGISFPTKSGICTKAAIVVACERDESLERDRFEVLEEGQWHTVSGEVLAERILAIQQKALDKTGAKISREEINVRVTGPEQVDLVVIDLPGIIHQGEGKEEVQNMIDDYIKKPQTLIMLVSEAKQDTELVTALGMARKHDPEENRTMRVLTKFDNFDSEDAKKRAVDWVCKGSCAGDDPDGDVMMAFDGSSTGGFPTSEDSLLAPHAVICAPGGKAYDAEEEAQELHDNLGLPVTHSGIASLKERLPGIYAKLINTNLDSALKQVMDKLMAAHAALNKIGAAAPSADFMVMECHKILNEAMPTLQQDLSAPLWDFQQKIEATKNKITKTWTASKYRPNAFKVSSFQGNDAFELCAREISEHLWKPILEELFKKAEKVILSATECLESKTKGVATQLLKVLEMEWRKFCQDEVLKTLQAKGMRVLYKEQYFGTVNHYFNHKYDELKICPDQLVEEFLWMVEDTDFKTYQAIDIDGVQFITDPIYQATETDPIYQATPTDIDKIKKTLEERLRKARTIVVERRKKADLHTRQKEELHDVVLGHWQVEHKTFVDDIMKEIRENVLMPYQEWVTKTVTPQNQELIEQALEDSSIVAERRRLKDLIKNMQECEERLKSIV